MPTTYIIENKNEALTSHSGLALIGALLNNRTNLKQRLHETTLENCTAPTISHADVIFSMAGLICLRKPDYDAIERFATMIFLNIVSDWIIVHPAPRCVSDLIWHMEILME